jgi:hypothetical protein
MRLACKRILPAQRQKLESKIRWAASLPTTTQTLALTALASMPEGDQLCHGDLHPGNILMPAQGEIIIDWMDASRGNALADVACATVIILGGRQSDQLRNLLLKRLVGVFHQTYLRAYAQLRSPDWEEYWYWLPIIAAARLSEKIPGVEEWLMAHALRCKPMPGRTSSLWEALCVVHNSWRRKPPRFSGWRRPPSFAKMGLFTNPRQAKPPPILGDWRVDPEAPGRVSPCFCPAGGLPPLQRVHAENYVEVSKSPAPTPP